MDGASASDPRTAGCKGPTSRCGGNWSVGSKLVGSGARSLRAGDLETGSLGGLFFGPVRGCAVVTIIDILANSNARYWGPKMVHGYFLYNLKEINQLLVAFYLYLIYTILQCSICKYD